MFHTHQIACKITNYHKDLRNFLLNLKGSSWTYLPIPSILFSTLSHVCEVTSLRQQIIVLGKLRLQVQGLQTVITNNNRGRGIYFLGWGNINRILMTSTLSHNYAVCDLFMAYIQSVSFT